VPDPAAQRSRLVRPPVVARSQRLRIKPHNEVAKVGGPVQPRHAQSGQKVVLDHPGFRAGSARNEVHGFCLLDVSFLFWPGQPLRADSVYVPTKL